MTDKAELLAEYRTLLEEYAIARLELAQLRARLPVPWEERYEALNRAINEGRLVWKTCESEPAIPASPSAESGAPSTSSPCSEPGRSFLSSRS